MHFSHSYGVTWPTDFLDELIGSAHVYVDLFFILSGFVLCYVYLDAFLVDASRRRIEQFALARIARLYPLHILTSVLMLTILIAKGEAGDITGGEILANFTLTHAWFGDIHRINGPSWSISAEIAAYILFPILMLVIGRRGAATVLAVFVVAAYGLLAQRVGSLVFDADHHLLRAIPGFCLGVLSYLLWRGVRLPGDGILSSIQIVCLLGIAIVLGLSLSEFFVLPLMATLLIVTADDRGLVAQALSIEPLRRLGLWSYSLYLWHTIVMVLLWMVKYRVDQIPDAVYLLIGLALSVVIAGMSYHYFERPAQHAVRRWRAPASMPGQAT